MGLFAFDPMLLAGVVLLLWAGITGAASDIDVLLEFRSGIIDDPSGRVFDTWRRANVVGSKTCPSNWYGVQCGESGISSITLEGLGLVGNVSLSALTGMGSLRNLSISNNSLTGVLPVAMAATLEFLDLSSNKFGGVLPGAFGKLGELVHLDLRGNSFSGDIDGVLAQLQSAVYVDFSGNQFSGSLKSISDDALITSSLRYLNVSRNGLTGELFVDDMVPLFDSLEVFDASFNQLSGDVPAFNFIVSLKILRLGNNLFSGSLPELLLKDSSMVLSELDLSCNQLKEFEPRNLQPLSLNQRLSIAVDISRGLNYLHNERSIPHGNLKSTNILIQNQNINALLADYSLHRLMTPYGMAEQVLNAGALGYRPPEFASTSKPCPSLKGDVYAFGVILLELLTGKSAGEIVSGNRGVVDLTDWVRLLASENRAYECFDRLIPEVDGFEDRPSAPKAILGVALRCIRSASERPEIGTVFDDLCSMSS